MSCRGNPCGCPKFLLGARASGLQASFKAIRVICLVGAPLLSALDRRIGPFPSGPNAFDTKSPPCVPKANYPDHSNVRMPKTGKNDRILINIHWELPRIRSLSLHLDHFPKRLPSRDRLLDDLEVSRLIQRRPQRNNHNLGFHLSSTLSFSEWGPVH